MASKKPAKGELILVNLGDFETTAHKSYCREVLAALAPHFRRIQVFCWGDNRVRKQENITFFCGQYWYWLKQFRKLDTSKVKAVHATDLFFGGLTGLLMSWWCRVPLVVRCGGIWRYKLTGLLTLLKEITARISQGIVLRGAKRIVFNAKSTIVPGYEKKTSVVYNGVDTSLFKPQKAETGKKTRLLYIGRLVVEKGLMELCDATQDLTSDFSLSFVGDGPLRQAIQKKHPFVEVLGSKPHDELPDVINRHDVLVLPSYSEGLPNVVLEAMACGKPVIATDVGGVGEMITDGKEGVLIKPKSVSAIKEALATMHDKKRRQRMGKQARKTVLEKFDLEKARKKLYEALYKGL